MCGISDTSGPVATLMQVGRSNVPATNLDSSTRNLQSIKHKHANYPAKQRATPYCIQVLPLLNRGSWKQLTIKTEYMCHVTERTVQLKC